MASHNLMNQAINQLILDRLTQRHASLSADADRLKWHIIAANDWKALKIKSLSPLQKLCRGGIFYQVS